MVRIPDKTLPWAILLVVIFGAVVLYFAAMLEVAGRISKEQGDLERLSRKWSGVELAFAEQIQPGLQIEKTIDLMSDFQRQLTNTLHLPWFSVLRRAYPEPGSRSEKLESAVADLTTQLGRTLVSWPDFRIKAIGIEGDLDGLISWIALYSREQMKAFRMLLVFLAASLMLGAVLLFGFGNLIRIQEARFHAAIDSMSDALILTDANNIVLHANPAAGRLFATNADSLERRPPPDTLMSGTQGTGRPSSGNGVEVSLTDFLGRQRPVSLKAEDIRDTSGRSRGCVYLIRDLTEWKKLIVSITTTFVSLQIEDADNAIARALDEAASLCGAEIRALLLFDTANAEAELPLNELSSSPQQGLPTGLERWVRRVAMGGEPVFSNKESAKGDDASFFLEESLAWVAAIPLWFAGRVTGAIALASRSAGPQWGSGELGIPRMLGSLVTEVLTKKWAMQEMERLGFEYRDLIENANVPIWGVDAESRVNEWNGAIASLTGHKKSRVLGLLAASLIDWVEGNTEFGGLLTRILSGEHITDKELKIRNDARGFSTLLVSGSPRLDSAGKVSGAIFIGQDISARVASERRIKEQADALVEVQEIERLRISRDLHDNVAQDLSAARITCETLLDGFEGDVSLLSERVARLSQAIASSLQAIRDLAHDLRPQDIDRFGFVPSLAKLCQSFSHIYSVDVAFQSAGVDQIPIAPERAVNLYRITQEALANAKRHAHAKSVSVALVHSHPDLILRISDDGVGFDVEQKLAEAASHRSMGLLGIGERAAILGATLVITSRAGKGTQIKLTMPIDGKENLDGTDEKHSPSR
jgi:PAS domain S-box-containing protein